MPLVRCALQPAQRALNVAGHSKFAGLFHNPEAALRRGIAAFGGGVMQERLSTCGHRVDVRGAVRGGGAGAGAVLPQGCERAEWVPPVAKQRQRDVLDVAAARKTRELALGRR